MKIQVESLKYWSISFFLISLFLLSATVSAFIIPANDNAKANAKAPDKSPVIDDNWDNIARVDFIHYVKGGAAKNQGGSCFKLMGVKWGSTPSYVINPSNPQGIDQSFVTSSISTGFETWDIASSKELVNNVFSIDTSVQFGQDGKNTVLFVDYPDNSVIAVTSIWYNIVTKKIVESDMRLNTRFAWGDGTLNPSVMDVQNIVTHESGHFFGLGDIYSTSCNSVTMFGYSSYGETSKRTLEQPDITGIQTIYGA